MKETASWRIEKKERILGFVNPFLVFIFIPFKLFYHPTLHIKIRMDISCLQLRWKFFMILHVLCILFIFILLSFAPFVFWFFFLSKFDGVLVERERETKVSKRHSIQWKQTGQGIIGINNNVQYEKNGPSLTPNNSKVKNVMWYNMVVSFS